MKNILIIFLVVFLYGIAFSQSKDDVSIIFNKQNIFTTTTSLEITSQSDAVDGDLLSLKSADYLTVLSIHSKKITDEGFKNIQYLKKLKVFFGTGSNFSDSSMKYLADLSELEKLEIGETKVTDYGLRYLKNLTKLHYLYLWDDNITDEGLKFIRHLDLYELIISDTKVTDRSIPIIMEFKNLERIDITGTDISRNGYNRLEKFYEKKGLYGNVAYDEPWHRKVIFWILDKLP